MEAAVAVIRIAGFPPEYLILRRALNAADPWSGHFSLPGGRRESGDADLLATCIRETREECGIALPAKAVIRALPESHAGHRVGGMASVTPFLFELPERPGLSLDPREISAGHWVPLDYLLDARNHSQEATLPNDPRLFPCIRLQGGYVWGFTYRVLQGLLGF